MLTSHPTSWTSLAAKVPSLKWRRAPDWNHTLGGDQEHGKKSADLGFYGDHPEKCSFSAFPHPLDKPLVPATEVVPHEKWGQVFNSLFKYPESLRIKTHGEEMRLYHYRGNLLLIWLSRVCFPAVTTKVCHENEHLPAFSEAVSNPEVFLVTFGQTCFSLFTRHNMLIKNRCAEKAPLS